MVIAKRDDSKFAAWKTIPPVLLLFEVRWVLPFSLILRDLAEIG